MSPTDDGTTPIYDLMSPIVLLRDEATTLCLDTHPEALKPPSASSSPSKPTKVETLEDFMDYVKVLLAEASTSHHTRLLSPTAVVGKRLSMCDEAPTSSKEAIEMAVLGAGPRDTPASVVFEIARNGQRVATVNLARPAYKLGETITAVIDFHNIQIPCYHVSLPFSLPSIVTNRVYRSTPPSNPPKASIPPSPFALNLPSTAPPVVSTSNTPNPPFLQSA